jgi:hypothetical protein
MPDPQETTQQLSAALHAWWRAVDDLRCAPARSLRGRRLQRRVTDMSLRLYHAYVEAMRNGWTGVCHAEMDQTPEEG